MLRFLSPFRGIRSLGLVLALGMIWLAPAQARAIEIKVSAHALERTLQQQLFNAPDGRYYFRGTRDKPGCFAYGLAPAVSFRDDRIVVRIQTRAKLGAKIKGNCLGIVLGTEAVVSLVPQAEGESIGFRDARVEKLSDSPELNYLLIPFLSGKLPQQMKINAADLLRQLLTKSSQSTGYDITLESLTLHNLSVQGDDLILNFDGNLTVH